MAAANGFSLVELMVSLLLGTIIILATASLFDTNLRAFRLQQGLTDVQEQGRFALDYIARDLRHMGLRAQGSVLPDPGIELNPFLEGGAGATDNDRLIFTFHGEPGDQDCEGDAVPLASAAILVRNEYFVQDGTLRCIGNVDPGSTGVDVVSGVDSFQVLYGIDTDPNDAGPFASRYVTGNQLGPTSAVVSVRVGLLVRSTQENPPQLADSPTYIVLDKELASGNPPIDERAIRRLFVTTVRARNVAWESI